MNRKLSFDETFFDKIDTKEKAYYLGFIFADGTHNKYHFKIKIRKKDREVVDRFKKAIRAEQIVYKYGKDVSFRICSKLICDQLDKVGCPANKSLILRYPKIDKYFNKDFIRGVFDGDGCFSKNGRWEIVGGSHQFLTEIKNILENECDITMKCAIRTKGRKNPLTTIYVDKAEYLIKIYHYLYDDTNDFLNRKQIKFHMALEKLENIVNQKKRMQELINLVRIDKKQGMLLKEIAQKHHISIDRAWAYSKY